MFWKDGKKESMLPETGTIFTVSALTDILRDTLEKRLPFVWVRGEITNLSRPASGHLYFSLKDDRSQLQCVWFNHKQRSATGGFDPFTGEVYEIPQVSVPDSLRNGMELLCAGGMSVYAARGQYQLIIEFAQPAGAGVLAREFERIKLRLSAAGYFALERKRRIPVNPVRVALITSPQGAAIHDFLELAQARGSGAVIRLYPVPVQGPGAAARIVEMLELANRQDWAQVIVLIRGGGSLEDLWAFNEEILAAAVFQSHTPVLAGIGHEVDFTLADMTADARAATPSHAAQMLWPLRRELWQKLDGLELALARVTASRLQAAENTLVGLGNALGLLSPAQKLLHLEERLSSLDSRLAREKSLLVERQDTRLNMLSQRCHLLGRKCLIDKVQILERLASRLAVLNPGVRLEGGYCFLYNDTGPISSIKQVHKGDALKAILPDGGLVLKVTALLESTDL